MNPTTIAMIGGLGLLAASCGPMASTAEDDVPQDDFLRQPTNLELSRMQPKLTYAQAQARSDQVKVGMPQAQIESMFGPPDQAGKEVYGRAAGKPWEALVWEYTFVDVKPAKVLSVVFQRGPQGWLVNHGDWYDPSES